MLETRYMCVFGVRLCTLGVRWVCVVLGSNILNMLKNFQKPGVSCAYVFYISNKFHARYRRVEYAMNAFRARVRHVSVCHMRFPILLQ